MLMAIEFSTGQELEGRWIGGPDAVWAWNGRPESIVRKTAALGFFLYVCTLYLVPALPSFFSVLFCLGEECVVPCSTGRRKG